MCLILSGERRPRTSLPICASVPLSFYQIHIQMEGQEAMEGLRELGGDFLEDLDSYLEDINDQLTISRMVNDSVTKGIVKAVRQMAAEEIAAKEMEKHQSMRSSTQINWHTEKLEIDSIPCNRSVNFSQRLLKMLKLMQGHARSILGHARSCRILNPRPCKVRSDLVNRRRRTVTDEEPSSLFVADGLKPCNIREIDKYGPRTANSFYSAAHGLGGLSGYGQKSKRARALPALPRQQPPHVEDAEEEVEEQAEEGQFEEEVEEHSEEGQPEEEVHLAAASSGVGIRDGEDVPQGGPLDRGLLKSFDTHVAAAIWNREFVKEFFQFVNMVRL
ncbi:hypothetical protein Vadar_018924 [Vaccinium darrowii]|uniref:Uncharacterized protein n=1 Tax=Vaccinium darrowii TaxID=229202 RepID=A0ACB7XJM6_9ERIC|nr:hypothetical protein Vadar_018924 [Vaccinium darrowii]